jgi:hypothetical protein
VENQIEDDKAIQAEYFSWQKQGLDISFMLTERCKHLITELAQTHKHSNDPEKREEPWHIKLYNDDTFESVWLDDQNRPCCAAMIDDGAPMGWRVEFLDIAHQRRLHELLLKLYQEALV